MVYIHTKGVTAPAAWRWRKQLILGLSAAFVTGLSAFSLSASAETAQVKNLSTGENFATIQAAIDAQTTVEGNIIEVPNGTYAPFTVDKDNNITIRAAANAQPVIKGKMDKRSSRIVDVRANGVTIEGLTVALPERDGRDKDWSKHKAPEYSRDDAVANAAPTTMANKRGPSSDAALSPATAVHGMVGIAVFGQDATIKANTIKGKLLAVLVTNANAEGKATIEGNKINAYIGVGLLSTGNVVQRNDVKTSLVAIASLVPGNTIEFNNFISAKGLDAAAYRGVDLNVAKNWWGSDKGIGAVFGKVVAAPWLCQPFQEGERLSVDNSCVPVGEPEVPPTEPVDTFAPAVMLTTPTEHSVLSGTVTFAGTVTDEANATHYFGIRDLSTPAATMVRKSDKMSATDPVVAASYEFDTSSLRDGSYRVVLVGDDATGNSGHASARVTLENFVNNKDECLSGGWERGTFEGKTFASETACVDHYEPATEQPQHPQLPGQIRDWFSALKDKLSNWSVGGWGWIDVSRGALNAFLGLRW